MAPTDLDIATLTVIHGKPSRTVLMNRPRPTALQRSLPYRGTDRPFPHSLPQKAVALPSFAHASMYRAPPRQADSLHSTAAPRTSFNGPNRTTSGTLCFPTALVDD
jgi:hypothetical protein